MNSHELRIHFAKIKKLYFPAADVRDIGMRAARDKEIIEYALKQNRIVVIREMNERLEEFFKSVSEVDIKGMITIVELSRYRKRRIN